MWVICAVSVREGIQRGKGDKKGKRRIYWTIHTSPLKRVCEREASLQISSAVEIDGIAGIVQNSTTTTFTGRIWPRLKGREGRRGRTERGREREEGRREREREGE